MTIKRHLPIPDDIEDHHVADLIREGECFVSGGRSGGSHTHVRASLWGSKLVIKLRLLAKGNTQYMDLSEVVVPLPSERPLPPAQIKEMLRTELPKAVRQGAEYLIREADLWRPEVEAESATAAGCESWTESDA